eukprot:gene33759-45210_t
MLLRLILALLMVALAMPAMASHGCHDDMPAVTVASHMMTKSAPMPMGKHDGTAAEHVCAGCIPPSTWRSNVPASRVLTQAIVGSATISGVVRLPLAELWEHHGAAACIERETFDAYFSGVDEGYAILLQDVKPFARQVSAAALKAQFVMSEFKLLIDTNVFIGLEDPRRVDPAAAEIVRKCGEHAVAIFVHEAALQDIARDKDQ